MSKPKSAKPAQSSKKRRKSPVPQLVSFADARRRVRAKVMTVAAEVAAPLTPPIPPAAPIRCDEVMVALVIREYDAQGRPQRERVTEPVKIFRASAPDIWALIDQDLQMQLARQMAGGVGVGGVPAASPAPPAAPSSVPDAPPAVPVPPPSSSDVH